MTTNRKYEHTCGGKPNPDGRILPKCEGCHDLAYDDGQRIGYESGVAAFAQAFEEEVRRRYDPFAEDASYASEAFRNGRAVLEIMRRARKKVEAE